MIKVVNAHNYRKEEEVTAIYIGRHKMPACCHFAIPALANWNSMRGESTRNTVIEEYRQAFRKDWKADGPMKEGYKQLEEIAKTTNIALVCWCAPKACHGDLLKEGLLR